MRERGWARERRRAFEQKMPSESKSGEWWRRSAGRAGYAGYAGYATSRWLCLMTQTVTGGDSHAHTRPHLFSFPLSGRLCCALCPRTGQTVARRHRVPLILPFISLSVIWIDVDPSLLAFWFCPRLSALLRSFGLDVHGFSDFFGKFLFFIPTRNELPEEFFQVKTILRTGRTGCNRNYLHFHDRRNELREFGKFIRYNRCCWWCVYTCDIDCL